MRKEKNILTAALMAIAVCLGFASCSSDDDGGGSEAVVAALQGTWSLDNNDGTEYPYFIVRGDNCFFSNNPDTDGSGVEKYAYLYNSQDGTIALRDSGDDTYAWRIKIVSVTDSKLTLQFIDDDGTPLYTYTKVSPAAPGGNGGDDAPGGTGDDEEVTPGTGGGPADDDDDGGTSGVMSLRDMLRGWWHTDDTLPDEYSFFFVKPEGETEGTCHFRRSQDLDAPGGDDFRYTIDLDTMTLTLTTNDGFVWNLRISEISAERVVFFDLDPGNPKYYAMEKIH